jgi:tRNA(fMet)-specific endonuclease VapC
MIILDTDHISFLQYPDSDESQHLLRRLAVCNDPHVVVTVISVEEQMRGWLQVIARYRDPLQQIAYYDKLIAFVRFFNDWPILPFHESSVKVFRDLQAGRIRISTNDLKIAASSIDHDALLLTRNQIDFEKVPGLRFEDWTKA